MKKKGVRSITAITLRLATLTLGLWLLCMGLLTVGTAQYVFREISEKGRDFADSAGQISFLDEYYELDNTNNLQELKKAPGFLDNAMLESVEKAYVDVWNPYLRTERGDAWSIYANYPANCDVALAFVDSQGAALHQSGDFLFFEYVSRSAWLSGKESLREGYAWLDLNDQSDERYQLFRNIYGETGDLYNVYALRLTGTFDGARFEPYALAMMNDSAYSHAVEQWRSETSQEGTSTSSHTYGMLDRLGYVEWQTLFDDSAQADPGTELVTIYGTRPSMAVYDKGSQVRYHQETYPSLLDLLLSRVPYAQGGTSDFNAISQESLWNMVVFSAQRYTDFTGYDFHNPEAPSREPDFTLIAAVRASPLKIAMGVLWKLYILTGVLALAGCLLVRHSIKKHLLQPLEEVNKGIAADWAHLPNWGRDSLRWQETAQLTQEYEATRDRLHRDKNEIARLNAALNYARTAEENRRRIISHLTHQLKTPLAVIHGYAEGLREHIAEDKRDHYVEMILSETERSDKMVLEMLDLSRLEAGKVKLSRDQVSLLALAQDTLDKLEWTIREKQLRVEFFTREEVFLTADESRMAQALENLATNAVKYTPPGGWIRVQVQKGESEVTFALENESPPLSQEAINKVWEPFYRTEATQEEEGTGLGLAIVKNVIELHGGTCFVRNIHQGVAFGFTIPF